MFRPLTNHSILIITNLKICIYLTPVSMITKIRILWIHPTNLKTTNSLARPQKALPKIRKIVKRFLAHTLQDRNNMLVPSQDVAAGSPSNKTSRQKPEIYSSHLCLLLLRERGQFRLEMK